MTEIASSPKLSTSHKYRFGDVPEWPKGAVCKTVKPAVQIRPSPPKIKKPDLVSGFFIFSGDGRSVEASLAVREWPMDGPTRTGHLKGGEPVGSRPGGLDKSAHALNQNSLKKSLNANLANHKSLNLK